MNKWTKRAAIAALVVVIAAAGIAMYSTWSDCTTAGGKTVRGLFWLECINVAINLPP